MLGARHCVEYWGYCEEQKKCVHRVCTNCGAGAGGGSMSKSVDRLQISKFRNKVISGSMLVIYGGIASHSKTKWLKTTITTYLLALESTI
jgi:hypothetical protein